MDNEMDTDSNIWIDIRAKHEIGETRQEKKINNEINSFAFFPSNGTERTFKCNVSR